MPNAANGPIIPERTSARTSLSTPKYGKRRSLPANPQHDPPRKSRNTVLIKPASPEVITSLIETLSAISSPVEHRFEKLPNVSASQSTPASPSALHTHSPRSARSVRASPSPLANRFGMDDESIAESIPRSHKSHLHPGHANSPHGGNPSHKRERSDGSPVQTRREAAYENLLDESYSIGNISIEPGVPSGSALRQPKQRKSLKSLRSARSFRSLVGKGSRDSLRKSEIRIHPISKKDAEPKHARVFITNSPSSSPSPSPSPSQNDITIRKRDTQADAFDLLHTVDGTFSAQPPPTPKRLYPDSEDITSAGPSQSKRSSYSFPYQDQIPARRSSKRHSCTLGIQKQRPKLPIAEHSAAQESEADAGDEQFHTPPSTPPPAIAEYDESTTTRRIEELKEQKAKRDQLFAEGASDIVSLPGRTSRSPSPSPFPQKQTTGKKATEREPPGDPPNGVLSTLTLPEEHEETAPIPTVPQRIQRNNDQRAISGGTTAAVTKHSPTASRDDASGVSVQVPQRTSSKLLKRLSQSSASPISTEKSRRRFSNPLGHPAPYRNPSYQPDSGDSIVDAVEDYLSSPKLSQKISHPETGRIISFSEVGDPDGSVVFCCVGMGLTRYITTFYEELAATLKLRLITPDRPGVGDSEPHADGKDTPLDWPDDIRTICEHQGITKFSIMAHSAGAIYALATALRMPQHIRCRVHLLAPWIPPSQMSVMGTQQDPLPTTAMPYSQRFLRSLPTAFLRAANSSFLSVTSNSITTSLPRSPRHSKRSMSRSNTLMPTDMLPINYTVDSPSPKPPQNHQTHDNKENWAPLSARSLSNTTTTIISDSNPECQPQPKPKSENPLSKEARRTSYESRLASSIWDLATTNANPSVDLLVCLERKQPIGFRYMDVTRAVVIHHGSKDNRVPIDNVKWLGKMMRRCEVRVLEGQGHGLMANASVMGGVLVEVASEWGDWNRVVAGGKRG